MSIVELIKQASKEERNSETSFGIITGEVIRTGNIEAYEDERLVIQTDTKIQLKKENIIFSEKTSKIIFEKGDKAILLRDVGGQRFLLFDKGVK